MIEHTQQEEELEKVVRSKIERRMANKFLTVLEVVLGTDRSFVSFEIRAHSFSLV